MTRIFSGFVAFLAFALSLALTIKFCFELRPTDGGVFVIALGVLWECAKLNFSMFASRSFRAGKVFAGSLYLALVAVLVAGSVAASVGYFANISESAESKSRETLARQRDITEQAGQLDRQLHTLQAAADADLADGRRTRALVTLAKVDELRAERAELHKVTSNVTPLPSYFSGLSNVTGVTQGKLRFGSQLIIGVMIELIAVAAFASLAPRRKSQKETPLPVVTGVTSNVTPDVTDIVTDVTPVDLPTSFDAAANDDLVLYCDIKQAIVTGELQPSYRQLRERYRLGTESVTRIMSQLQSDGVLKRVGNRYVAA